MWGNEIDVLAIVDEKIKSRVTFYKMVETEADKPGDKWFEVNYDDVIDTDGNTWGSGNKIIDIDL